MGNKIPQYSVLQGDIKVRCRSLLMQKRASQDVQILKDVVSQGHIHMHLTLLVRQTVKEISFYFFDKVISLDVLYSPILLHQSRSFEDSDKVRS